MIPGAVISSGRGSDVLDWNSAVTLYPGVHSNASDAIMNVRPALIRHISLSLTEISGSSMHVGCHSDADFIG